MAALVAPGFEISRERKPRHVRRHHHLAPYAALVLRGGYVEAGDCGRFRAEAGNVLIHDAFEAHQDQFGAVGADILNLPLDQPANFAFGRLDDPDAIVRLAERNPAGAAALLLARFIPVAADPLDWPDVLALDIRDGRVASLGVWAGEAGLAPSSVSRGFRLAYGVSPQRYRAEQRASAAARAIRRGSALAAAASEEGFADQPHLNRTFRRLFAVTPGALRRHVKPVQDEPVGRR